MSTEREALEYAVELSEPHYFVDEQKNQWCSQDLFQIRAALPDPVTVCTLGGLTDLVSEKLDDFEDALMHVRNHTRVHLISRLSDSWGRRQVFATAEVPHANKFNFGAFMDHETFLIGLMANFTETPDRAYLAGIASHIKEGKVRSTLDDGVGQEVTVKSGISVVSSAVIRNRLTLAPFRTFREVEQPASEFVFRLRGGSETTPPTLALIEADGAKWELDAMENIGRYLRTTLPPTVHVVI